MSDNLLTIKESAELLNIHWQTVRNLIKNGSLPATKIGKNVRVKRSDIDKLVNKTTQKDKIEVEIRFLTKNRQQVENKLISIGAKVTYHSHIIDHWFVPYYIKSLSENDEWFESAKGYGVRIREQDNNYQGKVSTTLEVKRLTSAKNHNTCIEHELDVQNYTEASNLLRLMEYKEFITIDKDRVVYTYKNLKIAVDEIKNFATGIEIEASGDLTREEALAEIRIFAEVLGLKKSEELEKTVTHLAMQKLAKYS